MSNKKQSALEAAPKHFTICPQQLQPQSAPLKLINQNQVSPTCPSTLAAHHVFVISELENNGKPRLLPLGCLQNEKKQGLESERALRDAEVGSSAEEEGEGEAEEEDRSLIQELLSLEDETAVECPFSFKKLRLQQMDIAEAQSFDEESLLDAVSEAVSLTEEEQHFFNNFVNAEQIECQVTSSKENSSPSRPACVLEERKRVIRNFFKPKGSFLKDDKTRCNSASNLDEVNECSTRNSHSPSINQAKHESVRKSGNLLSPFIE